MADTILLKCSNCNKEYKSKGGLTKHINSNVCGIKEIKNENTKTNIQIIKKTKILLKTNTKYTRQIPINKIIYELTPELLLDSKDKMTSKSKILKTIDKMHNLLYNEENIQGELALNDIINILFLKLMQPFYSDKEEHGKIDFFNKKYYSSFIQEDQLDETFKYFIDFNSLINENFLIRKKDEPTDIIREMGILLVNHPIMQNIFSTETFLNSTDVSVIQKLLKIADTEFIKEDLNKNEDIIGEIYEYFINGYINKKGSMLGQFFTPRKLMKLILHYKEDEFNSLITDYIKINKNNIIKIFDSCMGTGGWIVSLYNLLHNKNKDISFLLSGNELEPRTYQYGLMNLILTSNSLPYDSICNSSLTHVNNLKHNFIMTNPPFKNKKNIEVLKDNFNQDEYTKKNGIKFEDIYKLYHNNPCVQFIELNLFKLEEKGLCIIILPYGELFFSSTYKNVREYFMKVMKITDIIIFENGLFSHTDIKTCALIFINDSEGTTEINFLKANKDCSNLMLLQTINITEINKEPDLSWYAQSYINDETYYEKQTDKKYAKLGDILTLEKGQLQSSKVIEDEKGIIFLTGAKEDKFKKIKKYDISYTTGENVFISHCGNGNKRPIKYFNGECNYSNLMSRLIINDDYKDKISMQFLYYYLKSLQPYIETNCQKGSCNKTLDINTFNEIQIPIMDSLKNKELIAKLNNLDAQIVIHENKIKENINLKNQLFKHLLGFSETTY
jgi:type I restriction-modification system DNA methylase subunit